MVRSPSSHPPARWRARAHIVLGVALWLPLFSAAPTAEAADRPKVLVVFEASGPLFSGLREPVRRDLGAHVTEKILATCSKNYRFVEWTAVSEESGASAAAWIWKARVEEEARPISRPTGPSVTDYILRLRHHVGPAAAAATLRELETEQPTLYDVGQYKPSNPQVLQLDLDRLIERQFTREFLKRVGKQFLVQIPLGDKIVVDPAGQRVIVPLRRCDLYAGEKSELEVKFKKDTDAGPVMEGTLQLMALRQVEQGSYAGCVYGPVLLLDFPPDHLKLETYWDQRFQRILGSIRDVRVFMLEYQADAANGGLTSGGVILDPDPCGGQR